MNLPEVPEEAAHVVQQPCQMLLGGTAEMLQSWDPLDPRQVGRSRSAQTAAALSWQEDSSFPNTTQLAPCCWLKWDAQTAYRAFSVPYSDSSGKSKAGGNHLQMEEKSKRLPG